MSKFQTHSGTKRYGTLSHGQNTMIQAVAGHEEEFDEVDFQVEEVENIGNFKAWTRLSVIGCIRELQEPLPSERVTGQFYVDFFLQSPRGSAVAVRVSGGLSEMPLLEEDKEVFFEKLQSERRQGTTLRRLGRFVRSLLWDGWNIVSC